MRAAYARLTALMLVMIEQRIARGFLAHIRKISKTVREFTRAEWSNHQLTLKLDMLRSQTWRARVLKDLGGEAGLVRWERRMARYKTAAEAPLAPAQARVWRKTPERIAEELRQKAHAQKCAKATAHPRIFRDPFRVDQEGQFRLAPVPRVKAVRRSPEEVLATTPNYMERYEYNAVPVAKMTGYDAPVTVWPAEFRAAAMVELGDEASHSRHTDTDVVCPVPMPEALAKEQHCVLPIYQGMGSGHGFAARRNDKIKNRALISDDDPP